MSYRRKSNNTLAPANVHGGKAAYKTPLSGTAIASYGTSTPDKAYDGNTSTMWQQPTNPPGWVYFDLGISYPLVQVETYFAGDRPGSYNIEGSNDAAVWTVLANQATTPGTGAWIVHPITNGTAWRFVRFNGLTAAGFWNALSEIRITVLS